MNTVHAEGLAASAAGIPALLLVPLTPLLSSPVLAPAFANVIPAQTAQTVSGALIPVSVLVTVAGARILYKRNMV